jgi:hypothetical protein
MFNDGVGYFIVLRGAFPLPARRCNMLSSFIAIARYHLQIVCLVRIIIPFRFSTLLLLYFVSAVVNVWVLTFPIKVQVS